MGRWLGGSDCGKEINIDDRHHLRQDDPELEPRGSSRGSGPGRAPSPPWDLDLRIVLGQS